MRASAKLPVVSENRLAPHEIAAMRKAGACAAGTLARVCERVQNYFASGLGQRLSTATIDGWVREDTARVGAIPSTLGFAGYPAAVCVSPNDVVCHGIPRPDRWIVSGDIVNIDVTSCLAGYHGDTSATLEIGDVSAEKRQLVAVTSQCLHLALQVVREGSMLAEIGSVIETHARKNGCRVVAEFGGHGIGKKMHLPPFVSHVPVREYSKYKLRRNMAITIEPILTTGNGRIKTDRDGWTVRTLDGSPTAQFEHTILVTRTGADILTLPQVREPIATSVV